MIDRRNAPAVREFGEMSIPSLETVTLDCGVRLHILERGDMEVSRLSCIVDGGVAEAPKKAVVPLALSMLQEGSVNYPDGAIGELIEYNGARLSTSMHIHHSEIELTMLNSKLDNVVPLLSDLLFAPQMSKTSFEACREKLAQNAAIMREKVEVQASCRLNERLMGFQHPLARFDTPESVRSVTLDDVVNWHSRAFHQGEAGFSLYLAGRADDKMLRLINDAFSEMPNSGVGALIPEVMAFKSCPPGRESIVMPEAVQSGIMMGMPVIGREHPDYIGLRVAVMALGGYFGSRLMSNIREDKGYTYGINAYVTGQPEGGIMYITSSTDSSHVDDLVREAIAEVRRLGEGSFSDNELKRVKRYAMSRLASTLDTPFDIMDYHIIRQVVGIPQDDYFEEQCRVTSSLTGDELVRLAHDYLNPDELHLVVAGPGKG